MPSDFPAVVQSAALPPEFRLEDIAPAADGATTGSMAELPTYGGTPSSFGAHFSGLGTRLLVDWVEWVGAGLVVGKWVRGAGRLNGIQKVVL